MACVPRHVSSLVSKTDIPANLLLMIGDTCPDKPGKPFIVKIGAYFNLTFRKKTSVIPLLLFIAISSSQAEVINVPEDHETIQAAINASEDGDTVQVAEGEFSEKINLSGRNITLLGNPDNPSETIIIADDNGSVVTYNSGESRESILSGFTIIGGTGYQFNGDYYGGGIFIMESSPSIDHCIISDNHVEGGGGAIACLAADPRFDFCVIYMNSAELSGGAVLCDWASRTEFWNCTITDNQTENQGGGVFVRRGSRILIISSILWQNSPQEILISDEGSIAHITFSTIMNGLDSIEVEDGGRVIWRNAAISDNPLFIDPDNGDYRISWASFPIYDDEKSPCIDRANGLPPNDPDGTRSDMGALYFDQGNPSIMIFDPDNLIVDEPEEYVINVIAEGDRGFNWEISQDVNWVSVDPAQGLLYPEQDIDVFIRFNEDHLERGRYSTNLIFVADNPNDREFVVELILYNLGGSPPRWVEIPDEIRAIEGEHLTFDIEGVDPGDEEISIRMRRGWLPRSARLSDNGDGTATFSWDVSHFDAGDYTPDFILTDGVYTVTTEIPFFVDDYMREFELSSPQNGSVIHSEMDVNFRWHSASRHPEVDDISYTLHLLLPDSSEMVLPAADTSLIVRIAVISPDHINNINIRWEVWAHDGIDSLLCSDSFVFVLPPLSVKSDKNSDLPSSITLLGSYPNPFNNITYLSFFVPNVSKLSISLYSVDGKLVSYQPSEIYSAGSHLWRINLSNHSAGIYLVKLRAENTVLSKRIVLLK